MDILENLALLGTQDEDEQKKNPKKTKTTQHNTMCVGHQYTQAIRNNVNKT